MMKKQSLKIAIVFICVLLAGKFAFSAIPRLDVKKMGAKGDGVTNDTKYIQQAFDEAGKGAVKTVYIPAGIYKTRPLFLRSGIKVIFNKNAILSAVSGYTKTECVLTAEAVKNVIIIGNGGKIIMPKHEYTDGEWRMGLSILGATNILVEDLIIRDSGGDGFYIGTHRPTQSPSDSITLRNCQSLNSRRNGLSITNGRNILIEGGLFHYANGTLPNCGIDLEPDHPYEELTNITIRNVTTSKNWNAGIAIQPFNMLAPGSDTIALSVFIEGYTSIEDGTEGGGGIIALAFTEAKFREGIVIKGQVSIKKSTFRKPKDTTVKMHRWPQNSLVFIE